MIAQWLVSILIWFCRQETIPLKFTLSQYRAFCLGSELPKRPAIGSEGQKITLRSNFFEVKRFPNADVFHYDVKISDGKNTDKTPAKLNRLIIEELVKQYQNIFGKKPVYDGKKNLYSAIKILPRLQVRVNSTSERF